MNLCIRLLTGYLALGEIDAEEDVALAVDFGIGRVDVLCRIVGLESTAAEGDGTSAHRLYREHHAFAELVAKGAVIAFHHESGIEQVLFFVSGCLRRLQEGILAGRGPSEPEFLYGFVFQTAGMVVGKAHVLSFAGLELVSKELLGEFAHEHQTFAALAAGKLFRGFLLLDDLYVIAFRNVAQGLHVGIMLVLHQEAYGGPGLPASEALVDTFRRRHVERRSLLLMERAAGHVVGPAALQRHEVPYYVLYPYGIQDEVDCLFGYHCRSMMLYHTGT